MKQNNEDKRARSLIKPGAQFRLRHDPAYRVPTALTVNGTDVLHIAVSQSNKACAAAIRDALNEWSDVKASNDVLHRRLLEAEAALVLCCEVFDEMDSLVWSEDSDFGPSDYEDAFKAAREALKR